MLIEEKSLQHWINHFYGYGSWQAKIWFVAYEDGGGELPEEVADKLNYFNKLNTSPDGTLCDIREFHKNVAYREAGPKGELFTNRYEYRFGKKAMQNTIWKNLAAFVHGYRNEKLPDLLTYQKNKFAVQREALIQLYPLPSPHNHAWYYSWLDMPQLSFIKSRALYQNHVYASRMQTILKNIASYQPELVLMYGMDNINTLKKSVQEFFPGAKFKMEKAEKLHTPQYHRADFNGTSLLITTQIPALRHNRIETGFDWEQFGRNLRS
jgi:hypothetical protein